MFKPVKTKTFNNTQYYYRASGKSLRAERIFDAVVSRGLLYYEDELAHDMYPIPDELNLEISRLLAYPRTLLLDKDYQVVAISKTIREVGFEWNGEDMFVVPVKVAATVGTDGSICGYQIPSEDKDAYPIDNAYLDGFLDNASDFMVFDNRIVKRSDVKIITAANDKSNVRTATNSYLDAVASKGITITIEKDDVERKFKENLNPNRLVFLSSKLTVAIAMNQDSEVITYTDLHGINIDLNCKEYCDVIRQIIKCHEIIDMIRRDMSKRIDIYEGDILEFDYKGIVDAYFNSYSELFYGNNSL